MGSDCVFYPWIGFLFVGIKRSLWRDLFVSTEFQISCKGIVWGNLWFDRTDVSIIENSPLEVTWSLVGVDNSAWFVGSKNLLRNCLVFFLRIRLKSHVHLELLGQIWDQIGVPKSDLFRGTFCYELIDRFGLLLDWLF